MPKKFSIDIPRLMPIKKTDRHHRDNQTSHQLDSPPPTPKSLLPPLPPDVEAALRSVCAQVFNDSHPAPLPDIDHDLLNRFWQTTDAVSSESHLNNSRPQIKQTLTDPIDTLKHSATTKSQAVLRVDRVMTDATEQTQPHRRSKSYSHAQQLTASLPKTVHRRRPVGAGREDSIDTTCSQAQSDATDDRAEVSTALTSAVITPLKGSKRTSSHALPPFADVKGSLADHAVANLKTKLARQVPHQDGSHSASPMATWSPMNMAQQRQSPMTVVSPHIDALFNTPMQVSSPVAHGQRYYRQHEHPAAGQSTSQLPDAGSRWAESPTAVAAAATATQTPERATVDSRNPATDERSGRSTFRSRAASRARSLSRGVREYLRPGSRRGPAETNERPETNERTEGWVQTATARIRDLTRPGTSSNSASVSVDLSKRGRRMSKESFGMFRRSSADQHGTSLSSQDKTNNTGQRTLHSAAFSNARGSQSIETLVATKPIDLNRELPPLPAIDTWQDETNEGSTDTQEYLDAPEMPPPLDDTPPPADVPPESPWPVMSANAFPGDYEYYEPLQTPSPISGSSLKERHTRARSMSKHSTHSVAVSVFEDDEDDVALDSPKVARLLNRLSVPDLRPQLVHNRRPSTPRRPSMSTGQHTRNASLDRDVPAMPEPNAAIIPPPSETDNQTAVTPSKETTTQPDVRIEHNIEQSPAPNPITAKPVLLLREKTKKQWWRPATMKKKDWMTSVEKSQARSGMVLVDECAAAPVIRYS